MAEFFEPQVACFETDGGAAGGDQVLLNVAKVPMRIKWIPISSREDGSVRIVTRIVGS